MPTPIISESLNRRARHSRGLGPGLDLPGAPEALAWVREVLSYGTVLGHHDEPASEGAWSLIHPALREDRISGLALAAIGRGLSASEQQIAEVMTLHRLSTAFDLLAEAALHDIHTVLAGSGIEYRLLKGLATAHLWYDSPDQRHTGDVDLLVHDADFARASELMTQFGPLAVVYRGLTTQNSSNQMTCIHPTGVEIDLHRWITGFLPSVRLNEALWWENEQRVRLSWGWSTAMSADLMAFHALLHLTSRFARLTSVADLTRALERDDVDWRRVADLARTRGLRTSLWWAAQRASVWTESPQLVDLVDELRPGKGWTVGGTAILESAMARRLAFHLLSPHRGRRLFESLRPSPEFVLWQERQASIASMSPNTPEIRFTSGRE